MVWVVLERERVWGLVREGSSGAPSAFLRDPEPRRDAERETGRRNSGAPQVQSPGYLGPVLSQGRASREAPCRRTVALEGLWLAGGPSACRRSPPSCPSTLQHPSEALKGPSCWSQRNGASRGPSRALRAGSLGPPPSPALTGPPPDRPVRPGCRALSPVSVEFLSFATERMS